MKKLLIALMALCLLTSGSALARNEIGIYTTTDANPANVNYDGAPGQFTAYVVVNDPWNDNLNAPMTTVGGFEFQLTIPTGTFLLGQTYPPNTTNFATPPTFYCGSAAPVAGGNATLVTLNLGNFGATPGQIFIAPVISPAPSIPDNIAITDYNDGFSISVANPSSGDFALPIFGIYMSVVPTEEASWGDVKSLFR